MTDWKTAILNADGERLAVFEDPHAAYQWAVGHGFTEVLAEQAMRESVAFNPAGWFAGRRQNPLGDRGPERSWAQLDNLRIRWADVERLTLREAYERLMAITIPSVSRGKLLSRLEPLWPRTRTLKGEVVPIKRWATPEGMAAHLIEENDKLARRHPSHRARIAGLSLLPAHRPRALLMGRVPRLGPGSTFCAGSNAECRKSCLVFSGHNELDPHNEVRKRALTGALLVDPVAFGRVLYESCRKWLGGWPTSARADRQPFTRLNVFSDLPWELMFPELFVRLPDLMFYDYTKVPARPEMAEEVQRRAGVEVFPFPENYDLTFSASGTNDQDAYEEWQRGRRVAVVFDTEKHVVPQWYEAAFLPVTLPVVDGDLSDLRPLDPGMNALDQALSEVGPWTLDMTEKQRARRLTRITRRAFRLTFGRKAPARYSAYPKRAPVIVGLTYKAPMMPVRRAAAEKAQAGGRRREERSLTKRAFLVSVVARGNMIIAPGCPKTVAFSSPVIPAAQPGVLELEEQSERSMLAAKAAKERPKKRRS